MDKKASTLDSSDEANSRPSRSDNHCSIEVSRRKFKGVVKQPNGHWGAQIYACHLRIWLGTFKTEEEAAMAYDSAAITLRNKDTERNLPWNKSNLKEPEFQRQYKPQEILNMIKDGSYSLKFAQFLKTETGHEGPRVGHSPRRINGNRGYFYKPLFQKALTPSDVGNLNRLVIPKNSAVEHFPNILKITGENVDDCLVNDTYIYFYDRFNKLWEFRYCYWRSSHSFVFTKGWNRFVKEMGLKATDVVAFFKLEFEDGAGANKTPYGIDVVYNRGTCDGGVVENQLGLPQTFGNDGNDLQEIKESLGLGFGHYPNKRLKLSSSPQQAVKDGHDFQEKKESLGLELDHNPIKTGLNLFCLPQQIAAGDGNGLQGMKEWLELANNPKKNGLELFCSSQQILNENDLAEMNESIGLKLAHSLSKNGLEFFSSPQQIVNEANDLQGMNESSLLELALSPHKKTLNLFDVPKQIANDGNHMQEAKELLGLEHAHNLNKKSLKLFGVQIC